MRAVTDDDRSPTTTSARQPHASKPPPQRDEALMILAGDKRGGVLGRACCCSTAKRVPGSVAAYTSLESYGRDRGVSLSELLAELDGEDLDPVLYVIAVLKPRHSASPGSADDLWIRAA